MGSVYLFGALVSVGSIVQTWRTGEPKNLVGLVVVGVAVALFWLQSKAVRPR